MYHDEVHHREQGVRRRTVSHFIEPAEQSRTIGVQRVCTRDPRVQKKEFQPNRNFQMYER